MKKGLRFTSGLAVLGLSILTACSRAPTPSPPTIPPQAGTLPTPTIRPEAGWIEGIVLSPDGIPLEGVNVRIQATSNATTTDTQGHFTLTELSPGSAVTLGAWADGYYCSKVEGLVPPASSVTINMRLIQANDNPAYEWIPPTGVNSCYSCKPGVTQVWLDNDAHGRSAANLHVQWHGYFRQPESTHPLYLYQRLRPVPDASRCFSTILRPRL